MSAISISVSVLFFGLTLGLCIGTAVIGAVFAVPFLFLMVGIWLLFELWAHKYISKRGTFTSSCITEQGASGDADKPRP